MLAYREGDPLVFHPEFIHYLGTFHAAHGSLELSLTYGITNFLNISHESGHILTAGMELGRKLMLLRNLAYRSDLPNKNTIINLCGRIQNESKRNVFVHSYITSTATAVTFVERARGGDYRVTPHTFTLQEFIAHVNQFLAVGGELEDALAITPAVIHEFGEACLDTDSLETKSTKSPTPPISSAE